MCHTLRTCAAQEAAQRPLQILFQEGHCVHPGDHTTKASSVCGTVYLSELSSVFRELLSFHDGEYL